MSDERIIRIEDKLDKVSDRISSIDSTLAAQHESLKDHIRRTRLLEEAIVPMQTDLSTFKGVLQVLGILGGIIGVGAAVVEIVQFLIRGL